MPTPETEIIQTNPAELKEFIEGSGIHHVVEAQQYTPEFMGAVFGKAGEYRRMVEEGEPIPKTLENETILNIFYEPSTRTRFSFDMAAKRLGANVVDTESASQFSSAVKGETLEDTIKVFSAYRPSAIVLRHPGDGSAETAAHSSGVPVINAGDGKGQHPTQALLDMFTIEEHLGRLDNLSIVMGGDLAHGRTVRSLSYLLTKFPGNTITFVSPESLQMGDDVKEYLDRHGVVHRDTHELNGALSNADVVYWTRTQKERGAEDGEGKFIIDAEAVARMPEHAILMHPLPRVDEITPEVDNDPRAVYFGQAGYGQYVRMVLLEYCIKGKF